MKEFDKKYVSPPIKVAKYFGFVFILVVCSYFSLFFFSEAFSIIVNVFQNTYFIPDNDFLLVLGIPKVLIPAISISTYLLAGSIMLLADIFLIVSFFVGVYKKWTNYQEQLFALTKKLQEMGLLEEFVVYQKETKSFHLKKMSINWELEWIFPFVFKSFPPYFQETGEISLYILSLISFPLPILVAIITKKTLILAILLGLVLFILVMAYWSSRRLLRIYRSFKNVQQILMDRQQEKLLHLLFNENVDPILVHINQENLDRLSSERSIPKSFSLYFLSILLSIFSAIIGYVILAIENA